MLFVTEKEKFAWAVGFFEGEGCINVHTAKQVSKSGFISYYEALRLSVSNTDFDALEYFAEIVGCGKIGKEHWPSKATKPAKTWMVGNIKAKELLLKFYPYLSARRRAKAEDSLLRLNKNKRRGEGTCQIIGCTAKYLAKNFCTNHYAQYRRLVKGIGKVDGRTKEGKIQKFLKAGGTNL